MNKFKELYFKYKLNKKTIESAYEQAQKEIDLETYSPGLMAKAKSKSKAKNHLTEAKFIELRAEQLLNEAVKKQSSRSKATWRKKLRGESKKIYSEAFKNYKNKNFEAAITKLLQADKLQPQNPKILIGLAYNYANLQKFQKSIDSIEKALESGYDDFENIRTHKDFSELRDTDEYQAFSEKVFGF